MSATAIAVLLLPFARSNGLEMLKGYVFVISMTSRHGMLANLFIHNILLSMTMLVPSVFLVLKGARVSTQTAWIFGGLVISLLLAAVIGSKAGAGVHHLLPLIPMALYLYARLANEMDAGIRSKEVLGVTAAFLFSIVYPYIFAGIKGAAKDVGRMSAAAEEYRKLSELAALSDRYPAAQVGVSDQERFADSFYKVLPMLRGRPYVIDFSSWGDFKQAGYGDERLVSLVSSCRPGAWILPKGDPFTIQNPFGDETLLTDAFRKSFHASYKKVEERQYFDAWVCKRP